jgi:hypothetical protein
MAEAKASIPGTAEMTRAQDAHITATPFSINPKARDMKR